MLCKELSLRVSTLLKGFIKRHTHTHTHKKKKKLQFTAKINTVFQSRMQTEIAQQNTL